MANEIKAEALLLMDTCGERASVAIFLGEQLQAEVALPERTASTALLQEIRVLLRRSRIELAALSAIGVVSGPGSFTGVRVGLAVAKGLCEATGVLLAAVSRLEVLADAAHLQNGVGVLNGGRDQVYVREVKDGEAAGEQLMTVPAVLELAAGRILVCAETALHARLASEAKVDLVALSAKDALGPVRRCLAAGGSDIATVDANYVRNEEAIYARR